MQQMKQKCLRCPLPVCKCKGEEEKNDKCTYIENYLFFEYESTQDSGVHEANLVKIHNFKGNRWISENESFCTWLISTEHKGYTCIAHYTKGPDAHIILWYSVENI